MIHCCFILLHPGNLRQSLKIGNPKKKLVFQSSIFRGELLNFGGVCFLYGGFAKVKLIDVIQLIQVVVSSKFEFLLMELLR